MIDTIMLIISVAALGFLAGWYAREIRARDDEKRRVDRKFRHQKELLDSFDIAKDKSP